MSSSNPVLRGVIIGALVVAAAVAIYFGVRDTSGTPPDSTADDRAAAPDITWRRWDSASFAEARSGDRPILLVVDDSRVPGSLRARDRIAASTVLRGALTSYIVPLEVDRRLRPDIAERYAEDRTFQSLLILPTGEGLMLLDGAPDTWTEKIAEANRYWHEHKDDVMARAEAFWAKQSEALEPRPARAAQQSDLETIDHAVRALVTDSLGSGADSSVLWRPDIAAYLRARSAAVPWADTLRRSLAAARQDHHESGARYVPIEILARLAEEDWLLARSDSDRAMINRIRGIYANLSTQQLSVMAGEVAAVARLGWRLGEKVPTHYPGNWLNPGASSDRSLPHESAHAGGLDGYLTDALEWLDYLLVMGDRAAIERASALADSLWSNLWSDSTNGLRDKPLRTTPVREIDFYPRAQSGRAAALFLRLADHTQDSVWGRRADRCLDGFAPYVGDAGSAAAYYGLALARAYATRKEGAAGTEQP